MPIVFKEYFNDSEDQATNYPIHIGQPNYEWRGTKAVYERLDDKCFYVRNRGTLEVFCSQVTDCQSLFCAAYPPYARSRREPGDG